MNRFARAFFIVLVSRDAQASPLACEEIKDSDQRHFCRAVSKPDPSECEFIKNETLRYECRARAK